MLAARTVEADSVGRETHAVTCVESSTGEETLLESAVEELLVEARVELTLGQCGAAYAPVQDSAG